MQQFSNKKTTFFFKNLEFKKKNYAINFINSIKLYTHTILFVNLKFSKIYMYIENLLIILIRIYFYIYNRIKFIVNEINIFKNKIFT